MKQIQNKIKQFCKDNNLESPIEHRMLDTISELGEVSKEILKLSNYGRKSIDPNDPLISTELKSELGDILYSLITIANTYDLDLEDALDLAINKIKNTPVNRPVV